MNASVERGRGPADETLRRSGHDRPDLQPLSDAELMQLAEMLARYVVHDLDQFEHWALDFDWGRVYVELSLALPPGAKDEYHRRIWPPVNGPQGAKVDKS